MTATQYDIANAIHAIDGYFIPRPHEITPAQQEEAFKRAKEEALAQLELRIAFIQQTTYEQFTYAMLLRCLHRENPEERREQVNTAMDNAITDALERANRKLLEIVPTEGTVCRCGEAYLTLLRCDVTNDQESWSWHAVIGVQGELPSEDETTWDEQAILAAMREGFGIHCSAEGGSGAGRPFADRPWIQYLGTPVRTLIVSQRGGLDV